jgi:hypothetical protein
LKCVDTRAAISRVNCTQHKTSWCMTLVQWWCGHCYSYCRYHEGIDITASITMGESISRW